MAKFPLPPPTLQGRPKNITAMNVYAPYGKDFSHSASLQENYNRTTPPYDEENTQRRVRIWFLQKPPVRYS